MHIVHVAVRVKLEHIDAFIAATHENALNSRLEPGVTRFELLQATDAPERFVLVEHYKTPDDQLRHRETAHYLRWRDAVADMMAEPRTARVFRYL
jgi:(4S)-4-hydroxy-5-phosphonooxypentane-2,3-dione isomerase